MRAILEATQRLWWVFLLRGSVGIVFGLMAFAWPELTLSALFLLFGAYMLVDGLFGIIDAVRYRASARPVWPLVIEAVLGIGAGLLTMLWPDLTAVVLLMFVAAWAVLGGLLRIVLAFQIRHEITGEWILIAGGLLSILLGGALVALPEAGLISLVWVIGFYAVLIGALFVFLALRLRKLGRSVGVLE